MASCNINNLQTIYLVVTILKLKLRFELQSLNTSSANVRVANFMVQQDFHLTKALV